MPIQAFSFQTTEVTPAQVADVITVMGANPDTFTTDVDGYDGPIENYTENVTLTVIFADPWSAAKSTALAAVVAILD